MVSAPWLVRLVTRQVRAELQEGHLCGEDEGGGGERGAVRPGRRAGDVHLQAAEDRHRG